MDRVANAHLGILFWNDQKRLGFILVDQNGWMFVGVLGVDRHLLIDRQPVHGVCPSYLVDKSPCR